MIIQVDNAGSNRADIRIAVSGHRRLEEQARLQTGVMTAIEKILESYPKRNYRVYSCLAEGADRFLGRILSETLPADLITVLPLAENEYLKDFQTNESIQEYKHLRQISKGLVLPEQPLPRPQAYQAANHILAASCDLLVTLWDGKPARGPGGTAEVVELFRKDLRPLLWIHTDDLFIGTLTVERLEKTIH
jgi:hypothetical protein